MSDIALLIFLLILLIGSMSMCWFRIDCKCCEYYFDEIDDWCMKKHCKLSNLKTCDKFKRK